MSWPSDYWKLLVALLAAIGIPSLLRGGHTLIAWLTRRSRENTDAKVLAILRVEQGVFGKMDSEIAQEIGISLDKVNSSLLRLESVGRVHGKGTLQGWKWYFGPMSAGNNWGFSPRGTRIY